MFLGETSRVRFLHVQGVPMSDELKNIFTARSVSRLGYMNDRFLYQQLFREHVLPHSQYYWLRESLEERIELYELIVGFTLKDSAPRRALSGEFKRNVGRLSAPTSLANYLSFRADLVVNYPTKGRGLAMYHGLVVDFRHYTDLFPNTDFQQMSKLIRGTSWVPAEEWGPP
jgi:hypothetical protein